MGGSVSWTDGLEVAYCTPVQCSYGGVTMDYVPNGVYGDNILNFNRPVSEGSQETCNFLVQCQPDGTTQATDCWSTCEVWDGWSVDPATWNYNIAEQQNDAYRQAMENICETKYGFRNAQVLDVPVAMGLYECEFPYSNYPYQFSNWMVRQCLPNMNVLNQITAENYDELITDPEVYQAMDGYCLSQHGHTVNPVTQTVEH